LGGGTRTLAMALERNKKGEKRSLERRHKPSHGYRLRGGNRVASKSVGQKRKREALPRAKKDFLQGGDGEKGEKYLKIQSLVL